MPVILRAAVRPDRRDRDLPVGPLRAPPRHGDHLGRRDDRSVLRQRGSLPGQHRARGPAPRHHVHQPARPAASSRRTSGSSTPMPPERPRRPAAGSICSRRSRSSSGSASPRSGSSTARRRGSRRSSEPERGSGGLVAEGREPRAGDPLDLGRLLRATAARATTPTGVRRSTGSELAPGRGIEATIHGDRLPRSASGRDRARSARRPASARAPARSIRSLEGDLERSVDPLVPSRAVLNPSTVIAHLSATSTTIVRRSMSRTESSSSKVSGSVRKRRRDVPRVANHDDRLRFGDQVRDPVGRVGARDLLDDDGDVVVEIPDVRCRQFPGVVDARVDEIAQRLAPRGGRRPGEEVGRPCLVEAQHRSRHQAVARRDDVARPRRQVHAQAELVDRQDARRRGRGGGGRSEAEGRRRIGPQRVREEAQQETGARAWRRPEPGDRPASHPPQRDRDLVDVLDRPR